MDSVRLFIPTPHFRIRKRKLLHSCVSLEINYIPFSGQLNVCYIQIYSLAYARNKLTNLKILKITKKLDA